MAFGWTYGFQAWLARRRITRTRPRVRKPVALPEVKLRTPLVLALFITMVYSGGWVVVLRSSLPVPNPVHVEQELSCLALNIYHEARGEPGEGKLAVGHVVLNRVEDSRFPDSICGVVQQGGFKRRWRCQFTWWCDGRSDDPTELGAWEDSLFHARRVLWRATEDPTSGALWYHADYVSPAWRKNKVEGPKIGKHIFYSPRTRG